MKRIICLILCLILTLGIFGCAKEPEVPESSTPETPESNDSEDYAQGKTIACCMGSFTHPVHRVVQYGFCIKAQELGMNPIISGLDEGNMQELIDKWNSDIASNNAVGAMIWTGDDSCYEMMKALKEKGIYTVVPYFAHNYESTCKFIDKNPYYDYCDFGVDTATFIVDSLVENNITNGTVVITHHTNQEMNGYIYNAIDQVKAAGYDAEMFLTHLTLADDTEKCVNFINDKKELGCPVVAVVALGDTDANAWVNARMQTSNDMLIIAQDKSSVREGKSISELLKSKEIDKVLYEPIFEGGQCSAIALYELINGVEFNNKTTWNEKLNGSIIDLSELEEYIALKETANKYFGG